MAIDSLLLLGTRNFSFSERTFVLKSDLDALMQKRGLDAVIVACDEPFSAARDYLIGRVEMTKGLAIKKGGSAPVIFANPMEIEEAGRSGLKVYSFNDIGWADMVKAAEGDRTKAEVIFWGKALETVGVPSGKVAVYGVSDLNIIIELYRLLDAAYKGRYEFVGDIGYTLFDEAYVTKDADELARIRSVAERTNDAITETWNYIASQRVAGDTLVKADGSPFTIGDVKRFVRRALLDRELEDTRMIFAQGRDGGFPHSRGEEGEALQPGKAIVFDLFPRELGGGYYHDMTRTWCIGYAPPEVQQVYDQVMEAFDISVEVFRVGMETKELQIAVQDYFESHGHPTTRSDPKTMSGYVHSLGHGVGLNIHERPGIGHTSTDVFQPGNFITMEPGLYYPERGFGVRVEDSFYIDTDGSLVPLTSFRKDLVLPLNSG